MALLAVGVGAAVAGQQLPTLNWVLLGLIGVAALAGHMAVNLINEYQDFHSGLDAITHRTPFSGGSGALPENPKAAATVGALAILSLALCIAIGGYFVWRAGWPLATLGAVGIALILTYTRWITRSPWLCLLAPGIGFGVVILLGTVIALGAQPSGESALLSLVATLLVSELLLVNQLPDTEADRRIGRNHWAIHYGQSSAVSLIRVLLGLSYLILFAGVATGVLGTAYLLALAPLPLAAWVAAHAGRASGTNRERIPVLRANTLLVLVTLFLLMLAARL